MPIQDGNYVAPEWVNGQPPAINSQELNAISETLENDWRRNEVLTANTAQVFGLQSDATPDQVFTAIANQFAKILNVTVTVDGTPVSGVTVEGIQQEDGSPCVTDSSGKTSGICATSSTTITAISPFVDVDNVSKVVDTTSVSTNTSIEMTSKSSGNITVTSSKQMRFSPSRTSVTYFIVGGGASGVAAFCTIDFNYTYAINGSSGGYTDTGVIDPSDDMITITIGKGGQSRHLTPNSSSDGNFESGSSGGSTSISGNKIGTKTAKGGNGGTRYSNHQMEAITINGANGGSGGGGASITVTNTYHICAGNGGSNGSDGYSNGGSTTTPTGQKTGGKGQGVSTTFDGVTYSPAGAGIVQLKGNYPQSATPGNGAGTNLLITAQGQGTRAGSASVAGGAGGSCVITIRDNIQIYSGAGADGIAIFKWTT